MHSRSSAQIKRWVFLPLTALVAGRLVLSNREFAGLVWLALLVVVVAVVSEGTRASLRAVARCFAAPKVAGPLLFGGVYVAAWVLLARAVHIWDTALVGETTLWFVITAFPMLLALGDLSRRPRFFSETALRIFGIAGLLTGLANLFVFPLYVELILAPVVGLLAGMSALRQTLENAAAIRLIRTLLGLTGIAFLVYCAVTLATDWSATLGASVGRDLALPIWLSLAWLPYVFLFALAMSYEAAFLRISFHTDDAAARRRARRALVRECGLNVHAVAELAAPWIGRVVRAHTMASARRVIANYKRNRVPTVPRAARGD